MKRFTIILLIIAAAVLVYGCADEIVVSPADESVAAADDQTPSLGKSEITTLMARAVTLGASPEDDSWSGTGTKIVVTGKTGENVTFPASCGALGGLTWPGVNGVVIRQGGRALTNLTLASLLDLGNDATFADMTADTQECCTDAFGAATDCGSADAVTSLRSIVGTTAQEFLPEETIYFLRRVPFGSIPENSSWTASMRRVIFTRPLDREIVAPGFCSAIGGLTWTLSDAVALFEDPQTGSIPGTRGDWRPVHFEAGTLGPVHPGSVATDLIVDLRICCTNDQGAVTVCDAPWAAWAYWRSDVTLRRVPQSGG